MAVKDSLNWLYDEMSKAASRPINEDSLVLKSGAWERKLASVLRELMDQPDWKKEDLIGLHDQVSHFYGRVKARYDCFPQDVASRELLLAEWHETIIGIMDETRKIIIQRGYA